MLSPLTTPQPGRNNNNDSNDNGGSDKVGKCTGVSIVVFTVLKNMMASSYPDSGYKGIGIGTVLLLLVI